MLPVALTKNVVTGGGGVGIGVYYLFLIFNAYTCSTVELSDTAACSARDLCVAGGGAKPPHPGGVGWG